MRDVDALFSGVVAVGRRSVTPVEEREYVVHVLRPTARWSDTGPRRVVNRQFVVADPDGYLLRFYAERESPLI